MPLLIKLHLVPVLVKTKIYYIVSKVFSFHKKKKEVIKAQKRAMGDQGSNPCKNMFYNIIYKMNRCKKVVY